jgi:hypothetical protein
MPGERAPDGARLDLLTTGTQAAVEAGVSAEDLEPNSNAASLLDLTLGERAKNPATDHRGLPAGAARRVDGHHAIGLMCDSTEPEEAKRAASALLALLTAHAG